MTTETARMIVVAIAAAEAAVWLLGLRVFLGLFDVPATVEETATVTGKTLEDVRKSVLKTVLAAQHNIIEKTGDALVIEPIQQAGGGASSGCRVTLTFENIHAGVLVRSHTDLSRLNRAFRIIAGIIVLGLGLPALAVLPVVLWVYVAPSETAGVRYQVFQMLQLAHALWPPFLIGFLHKRMLKIAKATGTNLLTAAELAD